MKLYFICPVHTDLFSTDQWEVAGCEAATFDADGNKQLHGTVTALCPCCGHTHVYTPDELPCPLTMNTTNQKNV